MQDRDWKVKSIILNGLKIMKLELINVHTLIRIQMKDFLNFLPFPLSMLPKSLKLGGDIVKGTFPHLKNQKKYYNYDEPRLPALEFYDPENTTKEKYEELILWHKEENKRLQETGETWNFRKEIISYCICDVDILRKSAVKYRSFFSIYGVEPFIECITIASLVSLLYRRTDYKANTIGLIPENDSYRSRQSKEALKYLKWLEITKKINLQTAANGKEKWIHGAPVDGFDASTNTIYEFDGCYFHYCLHCYPDASAKNYFDKNGENGKNRRIATKARRKFLKSKGFKVVSMRECRWMRMMKRDPDTYKLLCEDSTIKVGFLVSRQSLYGGRTNAICLYGKPGIDEEYTYADFTSLYSFVNKTSEYPIGHPIIYTKNFPDILKVKGLVLCKVLPPDNLFFPVLPEKVDGKLLFHLCSTCARQKNSIYCTHTDDERMITGVWTSYELILAIKFRYRVVTIYELWDYPESAKYVPGETDGLFTTFVDRFLKIKQVYLFAYYIYYFTYIYFISVPIQEASGWPREGMSDAEKQKYIEDYKEFENISLERENIEKNPVMRLLAKLCLNSIWVPQIFQINNQKQKLILFLYRENLEKDPTGQKQRSSAAVGTCCDC